MKRRQLFARIAALFVAPSVIKAAPPQIIMKRRQPGLSTLYFGKLTPQQERALIDHSRNRMDVLRSQLGRAKPFTSSP